MADDRENKTSAYAQRIADQLITQLEAGTAPWQKPWAPGERILPQNAVSGRPYRGSNAIALMLEGQAHGYADPRWLTYRQAQGLGAQVRKGEKGTLIRFYKFEGQEPVLGADGQPTRGADGQIVTHNVRYERPQMFSAIVFNADQCNGLPPLAPAMTMSEAARHERAETLLAATGASIRHDQADRAFYRPATDSIHLPQPEQFNSPDGYYATALHEVGHWTGHPSRLDRDLSHPFGSAGYAREELRAEIASLMIGQELEIGHDPGQHAAYVQSWIQALREDPNEILRACADAERITKHVLGIERGIEQTRDELETKMEQLDGTKSRAPLFELTDQHREAFTVPDHATLSAARANGKYSGPWLDVQRGAGLDGGDLLLQQVGPASYVLHDLPADVGAAIDHGREWIAVDYHDKAASIGDVPQAQRDAKAERWIALDTVRKLEAGIGDAGLQDEALHLAGTLARNDTIRENPFVNDTLRAAWDEARAEHLGQPAPKTLVRREDLPARAIAVDDALLAKDPATLTQTERKAIELLRPEALTPATSLARQDLIVPYAQRDQAKALGAKWDRTEKTWYAPADLDPGKREALMRWHPDRAETKTVETPAQEFARALRDAGLQIEGEPVMDGTMQRVAVAGDVGKETSGAYVGYSDGHPAGYIQNFKADVAENWKYSGRSPSLTDADRARAETEAKQKLQEREAARDAAHLAAAVRAQARWDEARPLTEFTPGADGWPKYLAEKGIEHHVHNVRVTEDGKLLVPAQDADGKVWSVQTIDDAGEKSFMKGGRKAGCFVEVSPPGDNSAQVIAIAEGMATAATLQQCAPGDPPMAVYVAFDAYNLRATAETLAAKFPDAQIVVFGDDDASKKKNVGRSKAEEAAKAVGGVAAFPKFAAGLRGKDFNDLGKADAGALTAQIREAVGRALRLDKAADIANERAKSKSLEKSQERELKRERERSRSLER